VHLRCHPQSEVLVEL